MEDNLKELKREYNSKKNENNSLKLKKDYKEMKSLLKYTNKLLKDAEKDQKKWDKVWDKFHKEYEKLEKPLIDDESFNDKLKEQQDLEQSDQTIIKIDSLIDEIDKKIEELEQKTLNDRRDYFTYKQGDIRFGDSQCDFCKYNVSNNVDSCVKYPNGKPKNIINMEMKCEYIETEDR